MPEIQTLRSREAWLARAPGFHIGEDDALAGTRLYRPGDAEVSALNARLKEEGYFHLRYDFSGLDFREMARTVRRFYAEGIPPVFCFVFDEFWAPFFALDALYGGLLGPYGMLPDFWIWNIDPQKGDAGWQPHRDKGFKALRPDGSPKSLTTWIPLSDATPLNSCMYLVPANLDPTYGTARENDWLFELPAVRALPGAPGDVFVWNQAVLHWGSRSVVRAPESRVSMAFEFQRSDEPPFNRPILPAARPLPFERRLTLISKQVLQYRHMYRLEPAIERLAMDLVNNRAYTPMRLS